MIIPQTPYRISFFGGGSDYPAWFQDHGGAVLATTRKDPDAGPTSWTIHVPVANAVEAGATCELVGTLPRR